MNLIESETKNNKLVKNYFYDNSIKLLEYKNYEEGTNQDKIKSTKSNKQLLRIAALFEGLNKLEKPAKNMALDFDSVIQCLNLCMSYELY